MSELMKLAQEMHAVLGGAPKVWVVHYSQIWRGGDGVVGVYTSRELAEEVAAKSPMHEIEEFTLDEKPKERSTTPISMVPIGQRVKA